MAFITALVVGSYIHLLFIAFVQRPVYYECYKITNLWAKISRTCSFSTCIADVAYILLSDLMMASCWAKKCSLHICMYHTVSCVY